MTTLVGDVGGTNCRLAVATRRKEGGFELHDLERYSVREHRGIEECIASYTERHSIEPTQIGVAAAGPKFDDGIRMTNISWQIGEGELRDRFQLERAVVINDFVGMATGATVMPPDAFSTVVHGTLDWTETVTVLGPGTGMGISIVTPDGVLGTEGGHVSFAPETVREIAILQFLLRRRDYVSWENLVSGPGLMRIYKALCDIKGEPSVIETTPALTDAAGLSGTPREAVMAFCGLLGAYAGNAALIHGSKGGVVIAGGVARHVAPYFAESNLARRFRERGSGSWFVEHIPVHHMHAHSVALHGVASLLLK